MKSLIAQLRKIHPAGWAAVALTVALIGGLMSLPRSDRTSLTPFYQALETLSTSPALRYKESARPELAQRDVVVTDDGYAHGKVTLHGQEHGLLIVEGRTYLKSVTGTFAGTPNEHDPADYANRWITGDHALFSTASEGLLSPGAQADTWRQSLKVTKGIPSGSSKGMMLNGVRVLRADTPQGELYVTKDAPYRVVRFRHKQLSQSLDAPPASSTTHPPIEAAAGTRPLPDRQEIRLISSHESLVPDSADTFVDEFTLDDLLEQLDQMADSVEQLKESFDTSIDLKISGSGTVHCAPVGCVSNELVTNTVQTGGQATVSVIHAVLIARFFIEGRYAGSCTATATLPPNGTLPMTCADPSAGMMFTTAFRAAEAQATARAAGRRGLVTYGVNYSSRPQIRAVALGSAQVKAHADRIRGKRAFAAEERISPPALRPPSPDAMRSGPQNRADPASAADRAEAAKLLGAEGKFASRDNEKRYQSYVDEKLAKRGIVRDRLDWKVSSDAVAGGPMARGNQFDATRAMKYPRNQIEVQIGDNRYRVDSYREPSGNDPGEIVSRKAIDFDALSTGDLRKHLKEMVDKYSPGTLIVSQKYDRALLGKRLEGQQYLEVPESNLYAANRAEFEKLAGKYKILIRYAPE